MTDFTRGAAAPAVLREPAGPVDARTTAEAVLFEIRRVIVGQDEMLERVLVALLAGGHLLLEGVPGLAKTLTIRTLADALDASFRRIQFTPDLVPGDLVGTRIYRPDSGTFDTELGPVFCNFLLADEINRAPAKVQSALLEVMQERQVTIGQESHKVPSPFLVMATQNPIESEGTYPLPEAQVDRFLMKVVVGYPTPAEEATVVERSLRPAAEVRAVLDAAGLGELQAATPGIYVDPAITAYAVAIVGATREPARFGLPHLAPYIGFGASPRGSIGLIHAARALALIRGRRYVVPQDVADLAKDVLRHRIVPSFTALAEGITPDRVLDQVLPAVPAPRLITAEERSRVTLATGIPRTPARPGPGPTPEALLRALDVTIGRRIRGLVPGEFRAHELGGGTELAQVRPYEPGDDVRRIDWNVTARMLVPHVRVHVPERSLTTWLVLDESPSMAFGTADRRKADVAEGVALALGHLSTQHGNRLGVLTFGAAETRLVAPRGGRAGLLSVLTAPATDDSPAATPAADPSPVAALRFLAGGATRGGLVALVSDFRGPRDWLPQVAPVAARHGLLAVEIRDPREDDLPDVGDLTLVDAETGREVRVDTSSRRLRERFAEAAAAERASLAAELRRLGARHIVLSTSGEWLRSLAVQLRSGGHVA